MLYNVTVITCANVKKRYCKYTRWCMLVTLEQLQVWLDEGDKLDNYDCEVVHIKEYVADRNPIKEGRPSPTEPVQLVSLPGLGLFVEGRQYDDLTHSACPLPDAH